LIDLAGAGRQTRQPRLAATNRTWAQTTKQLRTAAYPRSRAGAAGKMHCLGRAYRL